MNETLLVQRLLTLFRLIPFIGVILLSGCVAGEIGSSVGHKIKGDYYLDAERHDAGIAHFKQEVSANPQSASAHYYYGRFLLKNGELVKALTHLQKARDLSPETADYHFWVGVAHGEQNDSKRERQNYEAALVINKNHLQSRIYLAHNLLKAKKYTDSLKHYEASLRMWPSGPSSLYNRALILQRLGRTPEEKQAWLDYLAYHPTGALARKATEHLNALGDFSYRNHHLGARTVTTEKIRFIPVSNAIDKTSFASLDLIGSVASNLPGGTLQVVVYQKKNLPLAKMKANAIKHYLLEEFPELSDNRIGVSWFDQPQSIVVKKKKRHIDESVSFFISEK